MIQKKNTLNNILKNIPSKTKIVFIDNIKYQNKSDLIVLPGIKEQFTNIPKNSISGLEYILLNPNIRKTKNRKERNTILLSTGGSDKYNITEKIVKNFMKFNKKFKMKIILGELYEHKDKLKKMVEDDKRFDVYIQPKEISKIMNSCTIGIVTFGVTVYEAAYLHLPIFVIAHSNENHKAAMQVEKYGWSKYLGKYDKINYKDMAKMIFKYINDERTLEKMKNNGVVDGKGNKRVVEKIIKLF